MFKSAQMPSRTSHSFSPVRVDSLSPISVGVGVCACVCTSSSSPSQPLRFFFLFFWSFVLSYFDLNSPRFFFFFFSLSPLLSLPFPLTKYLQIDQSPPALANGHFFHFLTPTTICLHTYTYIHTLAPYPYTQTTTTTAAAALTATHTYTHAIYLLQKAYFLHFYFLPSLIRSFAQPSTRFSSAIPHFLFFSLQNTPTPTFLLSLISFSTTRYTIK